MKTNENWKFGGDITGIHTSITFKGIRVFSTALLKNEDCIKFVEMLNKKKITWGV